MDDSTIVFTFKSVERILRDGGTSSWRLDRNHARQYQYAVCTRNARSERSEGQELHHSAFLIGKVKDVVPAPDRPKRYLLQFSEYASLSIADVWKGNRNPVSYGSLTELGIDPNKLAWKKMPEQKQKALALKQTALLAVRDASEHVRALTMAQAKDGLALTFGVLPEAIEITIRG